MEFIGRIFDDLWTFSMTLIVGMLIGHVFGKRLVAGVKSIFSRKKP